MKHSNAMLKLAQTGFLKSKTKKMRWCVKVLTPNYKENN
jgi:hypothetical protein